MGATAATHRLAAVGPCSEGDHRAIRTHEVESSPAFNRIRFLRSHLTSPLRGHPRVSYFHFLTNFLSAVVVESSGENFPEFAIGALMKLQS